MTGVYGELGILWVPTVLYMQGLFTISQFR